MSDRPRAAVIAHYNRPQIARDCIDSLHSQVDLIVVVDNSDKEPMPGDTEHAASWWYVQPYQEQPGNLSRAWNLGLMWMEQEIPHEEFDVAIINDDAIVPEGWFDAVAGVMREHGAFAACSGRHDVILRSPGRVSLDLRMTGWAFMLRGESGLRFDEQFQWWCGDTDMDWQARARGGMAMVRYEPVQNRFADQSTNGIRAVQAAEDCAKFAAKWGEGPY